MKKNKNKEELKMDPYSMNKLGKVPFWIKATFVKWWFYGAVYFFMMMSLTNFDKANSSAWQWVFLLSGLVAGAFYDLVINKILMLCESDRLESKYFSVFISKKYYAMIANIIYFVIVFILVYIFEVFAIWPLTKNLKWTFYFGSEPVTFGILVLFVDYIFIGIKKLVLILIKNIKDKGETSVK